jgi:hypothetical protein
MRRVVLLPLISILLAWATPAWAEGPQFNGTCTTITWNANQEPDLAGYRLYDRIVTTTTPTLIATVGPQITSIACSQLNFNAGQHYVSISSFDTSGNESPISTDVPFFLASSNRVEDLRITATTTTTFTMSFTEVEDGTGAPAKYDFRFATPTINFDTAVSVTAGTCTTPVAGTTVGATKSCTITGLTNGVQYQVQLVPFRGMLGLDAVFGPRSNIATGTAGSLPTGNRTVLIQDLFTRGDAGNLGIDWYDVSGNPWAIVSNKARQAAAGPSLSIEIHKGELPNDQWADVVIATIAGVAYVDEGVTLRYATTSRNGYIFKAKKNTTGSDIVREVNGSSTTLTSEGTTVWVAGDVLRGEAIGTSLCLYRNNVQVLCTTDATFTSGYAGMNGYLDAGLASNSELDTFRAGSFDRTVFISDSFTRGNQTGLGLGWVVNFGKPWAISGNLIQPPSAGPVASREVHSTSLPNRQWAQVTITTISGSDQLWIGPMLRYDLASDTGIQCLAAIGTGAAGSGFTKQQNNVFLSNPNYEFTTVWASGDVARCEAEDLNLRFYRNGILVLSAADSQFPSGFAGMYGYINSGAATNMQGDNYLAGSWLGAAIGAPSGADVCGCDNH